ncbi:hypothetical protein H6F89_03425 [Cyanobacteria bacterium FACHB-63]|nr:hypothetical protein [Cyanobacteria bacterium FACHB-63]
MTRTYSPLVNENVRSLLETLSDRSTGPDAYKEAMTCLGMSLGECILPKITSQQSSVYLACTVEDADFLAKGILERLEAQLKTIAFACFWNQRFSPFEVEDLKVAPILRKYQEPSCQTVNYLIVVKSIISGACVVRTNLTDLIQRIEPEKILIAAPVLYEGAEDRLKEQFEPEIHSKFQFFYFATDDKRTPDGEVVPGIGGVVYDRLGFQGQEEKNRYTPDIVRSRRSRFSASV